jgi:hypothetical protein
MTTAEKEHLPVQRKKIIRTIRPETFGDNAPTTTISRGDIARYMEYLEAIKLKNGRLSDKMVVVTGRFPNAETLETAVRFNTAIVQSHKYFNIGLPVVKICACGIDILLKHTFTRTKIPFRCIEFVTCTSSNIENSATGIIFDFLYSRESQNKTKFIEKEMEYKYGSITKLGLDIFMGASSYVSEKKLITNPIGQLTYGGVKNQLKNYLEESMRTEEERKNYISKSKGGVSSQIDLIMMNGIPSETNSITTILNILLGAITPAKKKSVNIDDRPPEISNAPNNFSPNTSGASYGTFGGDEDDNVPQRVAFTTHGGHSSGAASTIQTSHAGHSTSTADARSSVSHPPILKKSSSIVEDTKLAEEEDALFKPVPKKTRVSSGRSARAPIPAN